MDDPREPHIPSIKRILRYIRGTIDHGIRIHVSYHLSLIAYSDVNWGGYQATKRLTFGYCVFLGKSLLLWTSKRQGIISRSSSKAKYGGVVNVVAETCWLCNILKEVHCPPPTHTHTKATIVYCDSIITI